MDKKVLDEAVAAAWMAITGRDALGPDFARDHECMTQGERDDMRAALIAGVKVLLGPVVAEWRIPPTHKSAFAIQQHSAIRRCADELESIYAPSLGEGDV